MKSDNTETKIRKSDSGDAYKPKMLLILLRITMSRVKLAILYFAVVSEVAEPAKILGVFPSPSFSHQVVFRTLTLELVNRGHEVTVITPDPAFKGKDSPVNLTEIEFSIWYKHLNDLFSSEEFKPNFKRGVILEPSAMLSVMCLFAPIFVEEIFENSHIKMLIDTKHHFDLVISEGLFHFPLIFGKIFNAPVILINSLYGSTANFEVVGAVSRHPIFYPSFYRTKFRHQNVFDLLVILFEEYRVWKFDAKYKKVQSDLLKQRFGPETPSIAELEKNVALLLVNSHPIFDGNRPVPPGVVHLGALHLKDVKPLPKHLKSYLDSSVRGVIYVSLGTNVRSAEMDKDILNTFLDAFEALPYDILWKFDGDNLERVPKNVLIQKWFPQRDLIVHPNIKAFVMQGGLQSTDEAIDAVVPLVGIPMIGDQWYNVNKYVELGIGIALDPYTVTAKDLVEAVITIINDQSYKENMKKLKAFLHDQPSQALERAVWWTEHVLRHKDSRYLLSASAQTTWAEYLMLDVVSTAVAMLSFLGLIAAIAIYHILRLVFRIRDNLKVKQHKFKKI